MEVPCRSVSAFAWWLGFLLHTLAGLGVLGAAQVDWRLGFALLLAYFIVAVGFAVNVDQEPRLAKGRSAAWVLVCGQVLFLGSWLAAGGEVLEAADAEAEALPDASHVVFGG